MAVKPGGARDPASRLERLVDRQDRIIRRAFLEAARTIRDKNTLKELEDLLQRGRIIDALAELDDAARRFSGSVNKAFIEAAEEAAEFLNTALTVTVSFDQVNQRAVEKMRLNQLRLVRGFTEEQRRATQDALLQALREGVGPRAMARRFRESIGLTQFQQGAVDNYRVLLQQNSSAALTRALRDRRFDATVLRAIRGEIELTEGQIDKMVGRYQERFLKFRSETIARTEALKSVHEGTREMYEQAFEEGILLPDEVKREWVTAGDERVRDTHMDLDGEVRGPNEPFETGFAQLMFPGDPAAPPEEIINCRCALATRLVPREGL